MSRLRSLMDKEDQVEVLSPALVAWKYRWWGSRDWVVSRSNAKGMDVVKKLQFKGEQTGQLEVKEEGLVSGVGLGYIKVVSQVLLCKILFDICFFIACWGILMVDGSRELPHSLSSYFSKPNRIYRSLVLLFSRDITCIASAVRLEKREREERHTPTHTQKVNIGFLNVRFRFNSDKPCKNVSIKSHLSP